MQFEVEKIKLIKTQNISIEMNFFFQGLIPAITYEKQYHSNVLNRT